MYTYRNAQYSKSDNSILDMEIEHPKHGWIPFTLDPNDQGGEYDAQEMWDTVTAGTVAAYVGPSLDVKKAEVRFLRDQKLTKCDWTQMPDLVTSNAMTSTKQAEWATYRQELRDLPSTISDWDNVTWPSEPS